MLKSELLELIGQGEGATLEYKRDDIRPESLAKEIVGFANMTGGKILMGIEDDGSISGVQRDNLHEWLMDPVINRYVHPYILPEYEETTLENKKVAVINIHQGNNKPYVLRRNDREDIYVRYGNTCQLATREQQARLFDTGGLLSAEKFPVHGSTIADLDERRYEEYFYNVLQYSSKDKLQKLLIDHSFLVGEPPNLSCSYFAYALFAKAPKLRLPQAGLRLTVYAGEDKDYNALFDRDFDIPLVEYRGSNQISDSVETALHENIRLQEYISREELRHMTREKVWDYPKEVIRELVINALIHRDWTKQDYVRVVIYANRFEITSPGALPNGMTVERIKSGVSVQRNPLSSRIFRDYGYLEQQGMGIRLKVIPLMLQENGREPDFEATEDRFKVTLWKKSPN